MSLFRDEVAGRAQAVAVEHATGVASVAEEQGCRPVPWFHQDGMILVEGFQVFADGVLVVERFRHKHGHGVRQAQAGHDEEFQGIVQRGTITHAGLQDGPDLPDVAQRRSGKHALASLHPAAVATYGIDFAVMGQQPERLRQAPRGESIGAETRMHQSQPAGEIRLREVSEVLAHLRGRQHSFIYDVLARKRDDVEILVTDAPFYFLTNKIEAPFEVLHVRGPGHEHLLDVRLRGRSLAPEYGRVHRHIAQVHEFQTLAFNLFHHDAQDSRLLFLVFGQEHQPRAVFFPFPARECLAAR